MQRPATQSSSTRGKSLCRALYFAGVFGVLSFLPAVWILHYGLYMGVIWALGLALSLSFLTRDTNPGFEWFTPELDWALAVFLLSLLPAIIWADNPTLAWHPVSYVFFLFPLFFYFGKVRIRESVRDSTYLVIIGAFSFLVALGGLVEVWIGRNIIYEHFVTNPYYERFVLMQHRPISTQWNTVFLGTFLMTCLPFVFVLWQKARRKATQWLALCGICALLAVVFLTLSRGVFLALAGELLILGWLHFGKRGVFTISALLGVLFLVASWFPDSPVGRFGYQRIVKGSADSIISPFRLQRVEMALRAAKEKPIFGVGLRHFHANFEKYCGPGECKARAEYRIVDNMYLTLLAEAGVVGLAGFLVFAGALAFRLLRACLNAPKGETRNLRVVVFAALIALLINMGAYDMLYCPNPFLLFGLCCGFAAGLLTPREDDPGRSSASPGQLCGRRSSANSTMRSSSSG